MRVFRPLARVLIGRGITIAQITELMKTAYVNAAKDLNSTEKSLTDSRISLLTGLHRKDVKRLRAVDPRPPKRPMQNASALLIAVWATDRDFLTENHKPRSLARMGSVGELGFDDLVKRARIDLPAATLVTELLEQSVIEEDSATERLILTATSFVGNVSMDAKVNAFEKNLGAHFDVAADNLLNRQSDGAEFERAAHFNQLSASSVAELEKRAAEMLQEVLEALNAQALDLQDRDAEGDDPANGEFSVGGYVRARPKSDNQQGGD